VCHFSRGREGGSIKTFMKKHTDDLRHVRKDSTDLGGSSCKELEKTRNRVRKTRNSVRDRDRSVLQKEYNE